MTKADKQKIDNYKSYETDYDSQDNDSYTYAGEPVRVLDIFVRDGRKIALIEDDVDEIYEVFYDQLDWDSVL